MILAHLRRFRTSQKGTVAIEFAIVGPLLLGIIYMIFDVALTFFIHSALDLAVQKSGREIRTGQVAEANLTSDSMKSMICGQLLDSFGCSRRVLIKIDVVPSISQVKATNAVDSSGTLQVEEKFNPGKSGDLIYIEAFLPWPSLMNWIFSKNKTKEGEYVIAASDLFRNEPF